jgi:hypothetical protein
MQESNPLFPAFTWLAALENNRLQVESMFNAIDILFTPTKPALLFELVLMNGLNAKNGSVNVPEITIFQ